MQSGQRELMQQNWITCAISLTIMIMPECSAGVVIGKTKKRNIKQ